MRRRRFVKATLASTLLALPGVGSLAWRTSGTSGVASLRLQKMFGGTPRVCELGDAYRRDYPWEDDIGILRNLISRSDFSDNIDQTIRRDFELGNTIRLDGWILSRTEARQCALFSVLMG